jgi:hypothetical protein
MQLLAQKTYTALHSVSEKKSLWNRFIAWCNGQNENRLGWLAVGLAGHGCFITPLVAMAVVTSGNNFILWILTMAAMAATVIVNLAAMPTKITIPVFFFSIAIDIVVLASCLVSAIGTSI